MIIIMQAVREEILGEELPEEWRKKANVRPNERVTLIIRPAREVQAKRVMGLVAQMSREAKEKGLTEEKLNVLLRDES